MIAWARLTSAGELEGDRIRMMEQIANADIRGCGRCRGWCLARWWRCTAGLAAIRLLVLRWAHVPSRFLGSVHILAVTRLSVRVIALSVAWSAVVFAGRRAVRALGSFLRGDRLRVGMVVEVEPFDGVEVEDGCVDFIEVFDRVVEVFLRFE